MNSTFTAEFFKNNRSKLRAKLQDNALIIMTANGLLQKTGDNPFPFHQDSNFWYLTGINEPDITLLMDGDEEYIFIPSRSNSREAFDGAIDTDSIQKNSGIDMVLADNEGWARIEEKIQHGKVVFSVLPPPVYIEQYGMYTNPSKFFLVERLNQIIPDMEIEDVRPALVSLRMVKQEIELAAIQKAIDVTIAGITKIADPNQFKNYNYEFEIENDLTNAFRTKTASGHAFSPIVASGKRGVTLHNVSNNGALQEGELIVVDVGAEADHYAADITRTYSIGKPTSRQQEVYDTVLDIQNYALSMLKPGVVLKEYELLVEQYMGRKLQELGLIENPEHEIIRKYYPHATSHFLGLDVHDVGDYERPLEPGMVLTCEPGIYIPEEEIGVRIEDDVLITESGNRVLSEALPRQLSANA